MEGLFPQPKQEYKVLVRCFTFNHSKYIVDALKGFIMQQTDFPFVCVVVDDCSTDGEQDVIKAFLNRECKMEDAEHYDNEIAEIIVVPHQKNVNCTMAVYFLKENHYSQKKDKSIYLNPWREKCKYEALCEGDDYWIDPNKLLIQVTYMDKFPSCSLCFHNAKVLSFRKSLHLNKFHLPQKDRNYHSIHLFTKGWFVPTASILFKTKDLNIFKNFPQWANIKYIGGDIRTQMFLSTCGYFRYIAKPMSVYRFGVPGSATERSAKLGSFKAHQAYLQFLSSANYYLFHKRYTIWIWLKYLKFFLYKVLKG